jgi:thiol-disulfide isomerase/thioredoxin
VWCRCLLGGCIVPAVFATVWFGEIRMPKKFVSFADASTALHDEGAMPDFGAALAARPRAPARDKEIFMPQSGVWFNSKPVTSASLRGKVVLVDFWTYSCINSLRNLPYVQAWAAKYRDAGLVVIGVHTPEFSFEQEPANVGAALREYGIDFPVVTDGGYAIWRAFGNDYWPADYFVDGNGRIRYHHYGEGDYAESERVIQQLLKQNGARDVSSSTVDVAAKGVEAPAGDDQQSPETYVGSRRAENFASPQGLGRAPRERYTIPTKLGLNEWGFGGAWDVGAESAMLQEAGGKIVFRFHSRDLHVVLGPAMKTRPIRYRVTLDGAAPGANCGVDCGPDGTGEVREPRLYQLIRQKGAIKDRTFEIEFLDPGVQAFVFTFG